MKWLWFWGVLAFVLTPAAAQADGVINVPVDYPTINAALNAAYPGAVIQIAAGEYAEAVVIQQPVTVIGQPGATILGADDIPTVTVENTGEVIVDSLVIRGGQQGIYVTRSRDVTLRNNTIIASRLTGIKVRSASAEIINNTITGVLPPYGRGIHITNGMEWPISTVIHNLITNNAQSGIITNMAKVTVRANVVMGNGGAGIAITEMTHALVADNLVDANRENALYITDWSRVTACKNRLTNASLGDQGERYGNGIAVDYHSTVELFNNLVMDNANYGVSVLVSSYVDLLGNRIEDNVVNGMWVDDTSASGTAAPAFCGEPNWGIQLWRGI